MAGVNRTTGKATDLITFSRASGGTYLDSDGLLKTASTNIPRIEYAPDGTVKGLLIEESRTNLVTYSEAFDNAAWLKTRCTVTANQAISPDGTTTADLMVATGDDARLEQTNIGDTNTVYTAGVWVKSATGANVSGQIDNAGLDTQAFTATNDWAFVSTVFDTTGVVVPRHRIRITNSGDSIYIWGAQVEAGSFPTSYIPTSGATATRAADIASISVDSFGYRQDAGTVVVEFLGADVGSTEIKRILSLSDGTSSNRMDLLSVASEEVQLYVVDGGVLQVGKNSLNSSVDGIMSTVAACYKENSFGISLDGSSVVPENTATVPDVTSMRIGSSPVNNYRNGHIKSVTYYPRRLSNAQLQELTA